MSIDPEIPQEKLFFGEQFGVALTRYPCYPHNNKDMVGFLILHEDDEHWFLSTHDASTYWLPDLQSVLAEASAWVEKNCDEYRPEGANGALAGHTWRS